MPAPNSTAELHLRISPGIELFPGLQETPMAYVPRHRRYVRLNSISADIIFQLQRNGLDRGSSTKTALMSKLAGKAAHNPPIPAEELRQVLDQLEASGILCPEAEGDPDGKPARPNMIKLPIWRPNRNLMPAAVVRRCTEWSGAIRILAGLLIVAALAVIAATLLSRQAPQTTSGVSWFALALLVFTHILLHETAHGFVAGYYGVPVREFGIALLYWCVPVAYTDRTDCYRLRSFRSLGTIAAAGPVFDICATGATAAALLLGWMDATGAALLKCQLGITIANLNPLLPGDGYHMSESVLGTLNARRTAFAFLAHQFRRSEDPGRFSLLTRKQRVIYLIYAMASALYIPLIVMPTVLAIAFGRRP
jgi:putative peptide zinc metalloprotease protein